MSQTQSDMIVIVTAEAAIVTIAEVRAIDSVLVLPTPLLADVALVRAAAPPVRCIKRLAHSVA